MTIEYVFNKACWPNNRVFAQFDNKPIQSVEVDKLTIQYYRIQEASAKPLYNWDIVSVHFNHFSCMEICDKLSRHLFMLTYIIS